MGLNIGVNAITSGGLFIVAVFLLIMGILILSAERKIKEIPEYDQSKKLQDGQSKLQTAYILTFIAAGVALVLAIVYSGHEIWWCPTEWIHTVFFLIIIVLWLISVIYIYRMMSDLYTPELSDINGTDNFIWAALWVSLLAFLALFVVMSGRLGYNMTKDTVTDRFTDIEHKIHLVHSHLTGNPIDYDKISAKGPSEQIMITGPDGNQVMINAQSGPGSGTKKQSCNPCGQRKQQCGQRKQQKQCNRPQMVYRNSQPLVGPPSVMAGVPQYQYDQSYQQPPYQPYEPPYQPYQAQSPTIRTVTRAGPPVTTKETVIIESQPLVSTTTKTELSRSQPAGFF